MSTLRRFRYVGPAEIRERERDSPAGAVIDHVDDLRAWLATRAPGEEPTLTYVVTPDGRLRVAERRSEHVACAGGQDVLAAGELTLAEAGPLRVVELSNQSTGYCPALDCWRALAEALLRVGLPHPDGFTFACEFRRCPACAERNLVKDGWLECALCGAELPAAWNFDDSPGA
ncbi:MAG: hypothetical protein KC468_15610 [Myxococcales bacterium]|nr:hypothetical protein [Myxococcales bacterium]